MQKVRMGMMGGGPGSFIGGVHRLAANLDGQIELVCGSFSSSPEKSLETGTALGLVKSRIYDDFYSMLSAESQLPENERMELVSIVTPNFLHYEMAKASLEHGFHVICDKPMTHNLDDALALEKLVASSDKHFVLTHNYAAYPMVQEAKELIASGKLGKIRRIVVQYFQGWLSTALENTDQKQAAWRANPEKAGSGGAIGDIGTHAFQLAEYVSGLKVMNLAADLSSFVPGRVLDDDASMLLRFENGAKGVLMASQIAAGEENNLSLRIYGENGGIEWHQMEPNSLTIKWLDGSAEIRRSGVYHDNPSAASLLRIPSGHPEGFIEAFANLYRQTAAMIRGQENIIVLPNVTDGVRGLRFLDAAIRSSQQESAWVAV